MNKKPCVSDALLNIINLGSGKTLVFKISSMFVCKSL